jgi:hypothetical protein
VAREGHWRARGASRRAHGARAGARGHDIWRGGGGGGGARAPWSSWAYLWPGGGSVSLSAFSRCAQWHGRTGLQPTGRGITESERLAGPEPDVDDSMHYSAAAGKRGSSDLCVIVSESAAFMVAVGVRDGWVATGEWRRTDVCGRCKTRARLMVLLSAAVRLHSALHHLQKMVCRNG